MSAALNASGPLFVEATNEAGQYNIANRSSDCEGQFNDIYVFFGGYFGSYGPNLFAAAPDLMEKASAVLAMCEAIGDFRNGVTDPTGSIDEGEVRAGELLSELRAAISKALPVATKDAA